MDSALSPADGERVGVAVLGSTGSIGVSTLEVLRRHPDRFRVVSLSAHRQVDVLFNQCREFRPRRAVMVDETAAERLSQRLRAAGHVDIEVLAGAQALDQLAGDPDAPVVMAAIVGAAGLSSTLAAARAGKRILLANKESLVMSGSLLMDEVSRNQAQLLPIDSEHNAIFQCLPPGRASDLDQAGVRHILLTGSGGPFRDTPLDRLSDVTPEQACTHPNWDMGRKISVDSATMMNKGLEFIEACWLFDADPERIEVLIHPQSVIHSMVTYADGSVLAQLGNPDMRTPIAHALAWPERMEAGVDALDLVRVGQLTFQAPDRSRFPCLALAESACEAGGTAPAVLNAANEVAVAGFLARKIGYLDIPRVIEHTLTEVPARNAHDLDRVMSSDAEARRVAQARLERMGSMTA